MDFNSPLTPKIQCQYALSNLVLCTHEAQADCCDILICAEYIQTFYTEAGHRRMAFKAERSAIKPRVVEVTSKRPNEEQEVLRLCRASAIEWLCQEIPAELLPKKRRQPTTGDQAEQSVDESDESDEEDEGDEDNEEVEEENAGNAEESKEEVEEGSTIPITRTENENENKVKNENELPISEKYEAIASSLEFPASLSLPFSPQTTPEWPDQERIINELFSGQIGEYDLPDFNAIDYNLPLPTPPEATVQGGVTPSLNQLLTMPQQTIGNQITPECTPSRGTCSPVNPMSVEALTSNQVFPDQGQINPALLEDILSLPPIHLFDDPVDASTIISPIFTKATTGASAPPAVASTGSKGCKRKYDSIAELSYLVVEEKVYLDSRRPSFCRGTMEDLSRLFDFVDSQASLVSFVDDLPGIYDRWVRSRATFGPAENFRDQYIILQFKKRPDLKWQDPTSYTDMGQYHFNNIMPVAGMFNGQMCCVFDWNMSPPTCQVCQQAASKYKCPTCRIPYTAFLHNFLTAYLAYDYPCIAPCEPAVQPGPPTAPIGIAANNSDLPLAQSDPVGSPADQDQDPTSELHSETITTATPIPEEREEEDEDALLRIPPAMVSEVVSEPSLHRHLANPAIRDLITTIVNDPQPLTLLKQAIQEWPEFDQFNEQILNAIDVRLPST
ncbi:hypothetical protein H4R33_004034 [Dimargaris cristalligena]|nr:hypothetical protein H4R33_004034 [Dimargaris cristalligena]